MEHVHMNWLGLRNYRLRFGVHGNYGTHTHELVGFEKLPVEVWGFGKLALYK